MSKLPKDTYTNEEMILEYAKAKGLSLESLNPTDHEVIFHADQFAMDNDFYFFPFEGIYSRPKDGEVAFSDVVEIVNIM